MLARIDKLCVKSDEDRDRFIKLGASASSVHVTGDLKSEPLPGVVGDSVGERRSRRNLPGDRPIFTAGSTRQGEETLLLDAYMDVAGRWPDLLMVIAPRHPQRIAEVEELLLSRGIRYLLRTEHQKGRPISDEQVLLLDTIGELEGLYAASDLAFVGGSLVPMGGHNLLEPALYGIPVLFGPHTGDTGSADQLILESGGGRRVEGPTDLAGSLIDLLEDEQQRLDMGSAAQQAVESSRGALANVEKYYSRLLGFNRSMTRSTRSDRGSRRLRADEVVEEPLDGANL
jgi:3-deoxy-D-manno-octulosonic-acid transferase